MEFLDRWWGLEMNECSILQTPAWTTKFSQKRSSTALKADLMFAEWGLALQAGGALGAKERSKTARDKRDPQQSPPGCRR